MAVDLFLRITGIKGESTDTKHKDEIEIESYSFGQAGQTSSDGQRAGQVDMQDFHFAMPSSSASNQLMLKCAQGAKLDDVTTLTVRSVGASPVDFLTIKFYDALVSSFQSTGYDGGSLFDQFTLWFGKIEFEYHPQDSKGGLGSPVYFKWDRIKGVTYS